MGELAIVDDSGNSSLEVTFQKHAEVPNVRLFTHASDQLSEDGFEKERIVLLGIELFVVESDYLVKETAFPLVQVYKLVGSAQEKGVSLAIYQQVNVSLNLLQLSRHQQL